jgi:DNA-binding NarL/FixJ family response regulator
LIGILQDFSTLNNLGKVDIKTSDNQQIEIASLLDYERQMIHLICEAKSDHDIASLMGMDINDVKYCKNLIFQKTHSCNWAELVIYAIRKSIFKIRF